MRNVIIIGSGPAGYTAAIYLGRAGLAPLLFEGDVVGGQLTTTTEVENFPGFPDGIMGPDLMAAMKRQAEKFGTETVARMVTAVEFSKRPFIVTAGDRVEKAQAVIVATGASAKRLGLESERRLYGRGVSACATCDGFFFKNKRVAVVGGGDAAMEETVFLTKFASHVTLLVRRDALRASKAMQERVLGNPKISIRWNALVEEVLGVEEGHVTGLRLKDAKTGELSELPVDGVFTAIGHAPNTGLFGSSLETDHLGYIVTHGGTATSVAGVFACGDVQDARYRQAISAAGSGCVAALDVQRFLAEQP